MPSSLLTIQGRDVLLFRDGRPFANDPGAYSAFTLPMPLPGTLAGMLRTLYGDSTPAWDWSDVARQEEVKQLPVHGPLLLRDCRAVFHAPADAIVVRDPKEKLLSVVPLLPYTGAGSTDLPDAQAGLLPLTVKAEVKPERGYHYWSWDDLLPWLATSPAADFKVPEQIKGPPREERTHVAIDEKTGVSLEGALFTAQFLAFEEYKAPVQKSDHDNPDDQDTPPVTRELTRWAYLARFGSDAPLSGMTPFGGERRMATITPTTYWPDCPESLQQSLNTADGVRMLLATPAIFADGWKPAWLDAKLEGTPPGSTVKLRLRAAAVLRREPVSGWEYRLPTAEEKSKPATPPRQHGPKPVRWMVPAGSVYFFEKVAYAPEAPDAIVPGHPECWLQPVSDEEQDRTDGYGLALWGAWNPEGDASR